MLDLPFSCRSHKKKSSHPPSLISNSQWCFGFVADVVIVGCLEFRGSCPQIDNSGLIPLGRVPRKGVGLQLKGVLRPNVVRLRADYAGLGEQVNIWRLCLQGLLKKVLKVYDYFGYYYKVKLYCKFIINSCFSLSTNK